MFGSVAGLGLGALTGGLLGGGKAGALKMLTSGGGGKI